MANFLHSIWKNAFFILSSLKFEILQTKILRLGWKLTVGINILELNHKNIVYLENLPLKWLYAIGKTTFYLSSKMKSPSITPDSPSHFGCMDQFESLRTAETDKLRNFWSVRSIIYPTHVVIHCNSVIQFYSRGSPNSLWSKPWGYTISEGISEIRKFLNSSDSALCPFPKTYWHPPFPPTFRHSHNWQN